MSFKIKFYDKIVAVLLLLAALVVVTVIILAGSFQKWFADRTFYYSIFQENIDKGTNIVLKDVGIKIGSVSEAKLTERNDIMVQYFVYDEYKSKVREDTIAYLNSVAFGVLGKNIALSIGSPELPMIESGRKIPSDQSYEGRVMLSAVSPEADDSPVGAIMQNVTQLTGNLAKMTEPGGYLMGIMKNAEVMTRRISKAEAFIQPILGDPIYTNMVKMSNNIEKDVQTLTIMLSQFQGIVDGDVQPFVKRNLERVDLLMANMTMKFNNILEQTDYWINWINSVVENLMKRSDPILRDVTGFLQTTLRNVNTKLNSMLSQTEKTANALMGGISNNFGAYIKDLNIIMKNVKSITNRIDNLLVRVENIPLLPDSKKIDMQNLELEDRGF